MICDGWTPDQLLERQVENIERYGFTLLTLTGALPWTYSIGLRWSLRIPELIVVGWPAEQAAAVLHHVVDAVRQGSDGIRCGSVVTIGEGSVGFGRVAPGNLTGAWFAQWHRVARACGHGHHPLSALQAQPGCGADCGEPHDLLDHALARRVTPERLATARTRRLHGDAQGPDQSERETRDE